MSSILFIAPHKQIAITAKEILQSMNQNINVVIATNMNAVTIAQNSSASIIISRGGTARDLKRYTKKMIVEIHASFMDLSTVIQKLSIAGSKNIAIISSVNIIENMNTHFTLGHIHIQLCPYINDKESIEKVKNLIAGGVDGLAGDIKVVATAEKLALKNCLYLKSGNLSITKAINQALSLVSYMHSNQLQLQTMLSIINNIDEGIIVYNQNQQIIYYNKEGQKIIKANRLFSVVNTKSSSLQLFNKYKGKVIELNGEKLLLDIINLNITNNYKNSIFIFQKVSNIENSARKIRSSLHQKGLYAKKNFIDIICISPQMQTVLNRAKQFATSHSNVLIYGETGTGKEGLAQSIHNASLRHNKPFVSVNCASLPPSLIESELFGYVDGAFTGARHSGKKGLFELAHTGTIFLDEIGDLPLNIQSRLLRVLQEREIMRIGDDKILPIDIRIICATNKDLKKLIKDGLFRQDLYYRINVLRITLPPLRDRKEDIMPLFYHYLAEYSNHLKIAKFPHKITTYLENYSWPGNVRELKNTAEVTAFIYSKEIPSLQQIKDILDVDSNGDQENVFKIDANSNLKSIERNIIEQLLKKYSADEVCHILGISRVTLWRKCK